MKTSGFFPVSILYKSTAVRYRPVSYPDGPITARCRFIKNASWVPLIFFLLYNYVHFFFSAPQYALRLNTSISLHLFDIISVRLIHKCSVCLSRCCLRVRLRIDTSISLHLFDIILMKLIYKCSFCLSFLIPSPLYTSYIYLVKIICLEPPWEANL